MQFVAGLFTSGAAAGGATAAAGTGFSLAGLLQGGATVMGALASIGAGRAQAASYKSQAAETELEATADQTQSLQKQTAMKRELLRVLGENDVASAAAGIDLGSGLAAQTAYDVKSRAATEIAIDRATADARQAMFRARAAGLRQMAKDAKRTAGYAAFGQLAQGVADIAMRG